VVRRIAAALAVTFVGCGSPATVVVEEKTPAKKAGDAKAKPDAKTPPKPDPTPEPPALTLPKTLALADAEAKAAEIHGSRRQSFFCGCSYTPQMRTIRQSCGYKTRADDSLAHDVVWTHVVPPDAFGAHRTCWTTEACRKDDGTTFGGIECCRTQDQVFAAMEADLHNLVPAIAEVAKDRSDYPFGDIKGEARMYGACDIEVDSSKAIVEAPEKVRGDIARVYLYMRAVYGDELKVPADQWALFDVWNVEDPPDAWELERAAAVTAVQGVAHPLLQGGAPPAVPAKAPDDAKAPEAKGDAKAPDAKTPDAKAPDAKLPTKTG
jgi:deoxyribonuclease-1